LEKDVNAKKKVGGLELPVCARQDDLLERRVAKEH